MSPFAIFPISNSIASVEGDGPPIPQTGGKNNLQKKIRRIRTAQKKSAINANEIINKILTKAEKEKLDPDLYIEKKPKSELNPEIEQLLQQLYTELDKQDKYQSQLVKPTTSHPNTQPVRDVVAKNDSSIGSKTEPSMIEIQVANDGLCFFRAILVDKTQCLDYANAQKTDVQEIEGLIKGSLNTELETALKAALSSSTSINTRPSLIHSKSDEEVITLLNNNLAKWYSGTALALLFDQSANENDFNEFNVFSDAVFTCLNTQFDTNNLVHHSGNHYNVKIRKPIEN
ncbi:hypothetical protein [Vibrio aestuarianus]|uniref:hypothetical protein n=1 Tax=Vibrio aestuarianus TaxID=28171 RepID=UPI00237CF1D2|nr:hypothetical protein [Vibrio aestuarianus]MDE1335792.1 hypothetical protein [Vibrio aestuarianus]